MVVITPSSNRANNKDVEDLKGFLDYTLPKVGKKLMADFSAVIIEDNRCDHVFFPIDDTRHDVTFIDMKEAIKSPGLITLMCSNCGEESKAAQMPPTINKPEFRRNQDVAEKTM